MSQKNRVLIVGGPGSGEMAASVFEAVAQVSGEWIVEGFLNDVVPPGERIGRYRVVGTMDEMADFVGKGYYIHYTLHCTSKDKFERVERFKKLQIPLEAMATAVHPKAYLDPSTKIGKGVLISPFMATSTNVNIGNFVHAYAHSYFAHDSVIEDFVTITAHSVIGARVHVGEGSQIGLNSTIREDVKIGKFVLVGMGSVVIDHVDASNVVVGNPAKKLRRSN